MNTLATPPVSALLRRLFAEAEAADAPLRRDLARRTPEERAALLRTARTDYRAFYGMAREMFLPVSPATGTLLYALARATRAHEVVEFGTSFGLSTIHLAAALRDNGGGRLIGSEFEPAKAARARAHLAEAGLADLVEVREGDAVETLARELPARIDLVLLDGAKVLYPRVLSLLEARLAVGAVVIADNADDSPEYLARVRESGGRYASVSVADDVELSTFLG